MELTLSVLVHTFDRYRHLWQGCLDAWQQHSEYTGAFYLGTDIETDFKHDYIGKNILLSGHGEWSDRLIRLLGQVNTTHVLYCQEDHWPHGELPIQKAISCLLERPNLLRLQIAPVNQFYSLYGSELPLFFHPSSKYLVSHQPSIWKKEFLISCLQSGETPWVNEYEGTKRLKNSPEIRDRIAIYPYDWYRHKCVRGVVQS